MSDDKVSSPSRDEITGLPRWARVVFAARCARRVQPLLKASWPDAPHEHFVALETAIAVGEHASAAAVGATVTAAAVAANAATATNLAYAGSAAYVADAASCAYSPYSAADAADVAECAAVRASLGPTTRKQMRRDFDLLRIAAEQEKWTDDTPVPPEFFGPLWAEGVPEGWPVQEESSEGCELVFEIDVPEGTSDEELHEKVLDLVGRADDLHRAHGGNGLRVKSVDVHDEVPVREEVCS